MKTQEKSFILKGDILFTATMEKFSVFPQSYLVVVAGKIAGVYEQIPAKYLSLPIEDKGKQLIIPGFVDLHTHAPQFQQIGLGMDDELLDWLEKYTFPEENKFKDPAYAAKIYGSFVDEIADSGTTRSVLFATIHSEASQILFDLLKTKGLSAYVGKVNMDVNCPDFLQEDTEQSLIDTEKLLNAWAGDALVKPIITPRFAPTSTRRQLEGLGQLAQKYQLPVQSHLSENEGEIRWVEELFPEDKAYYKVYDHYGLFGQTPTLMAHCIHLTDEEIALLAEKKVIPVHCPDSNLNLTSGLMPARKMLQAGVKVGLGSDVGAGNSLFMPQTMVRAIQVSKMYEMQHREDKALTLPEVFFMATKGGGEFFGGTGTFEAGAAADILVIELPQQKEVLTVEEKLQYFIYNGTKRSIKEKYVAGQKLR